MVFTIIGVILVIGFLFVAIWYTNGQMSSSKSQDETDTDDTKDTD